MTKDLETSIELTFSQADFDRFARLSGDDNPIHVDEAFSARTRFGRPVAHGLFLCSVLRGLLDKLAPGGRLREQSVMFPAPTYAGEPMRFTVALSDSGGDGAEKEIDFKMEVIRVLDGIVTCQGNGQVLT